MYILEFLSYFFLNFILLLCFVLVVHCSGVPVLRMRGALANDTIRYDMI